MERNKWYIIFGQNVSDKHKNAFDYNISGMQGIKKVIMWMSNGCL